MDPHAFLEARSFFSRGKNAKASHDDFRVEIKRRESYKSMTSCSSNLTIELH